MRRFEVTATVYISIEIRDQDVIERVAGSGETSGDASSTRRSRRPKT
jgi:hypothetical protein